MLNRKRVLKYDYKHIKYISFRAKQGVKFLTQTVLIIDINNTGKEITCLASIILGGHIQWKVLGPTIMGGQYVMYTNDFYLL